MFFVCLRVANFDNVDRWFPGLVLPIDRQTIYLEKQLQNRLNISARTSLYLIYILKSLLTKGKIGFPYVENRKKSNMYEYLTFALLQPLRTDVHTIS